MSRYVALVRGINVGPTTKVPMPVLRSIFDEIGCTDVTTLINSGNVVFTAPTPPDTGDLAARIAELTGVVTRVLIVPAARFREIADAVPFDGNEARIFVSFMPSVPAVPIPDDLGEERIHLGAHAVYQQIPDGASNTRLKPSFWKQFPPETTARNIRTVKKLVALL